jgi:hypothetical protein
MHTVLPPVLQSARSLAEVSMILKDPLLVAGLNQSQEGSEFLIMKDFLAQRITMAPLGGGWTPLAGPIRHFTAKMNIPGIREKSFKQLFIFTDGDANVGEQPLEDAKMAVKEAWTKSRIKTFVIGIFVNDEQKGKIEGLLDAIVGQGNYLLLSLKEVGRMGTFFERYYRRLVSRLR